MQSTRLDHITCPGCYGQCRGMQAAGMIIESQFPYILDTLCCAHIKSNLEKSL